MHERLLVGPEQLINLIKNLLHDYWGKRLLPIILYDANVTGYWKTDHVRTFGQLLFIGPANSHTHTLLVHCCINGLS